MTPSVSTLGLKSGGFGGAEVRLGAAVRGGVVGGSVEPAAPHDADPGRGQGSAPRGDSFAGGAGAFIDVGGPPSLGNSKPTAAGNNHPPGGVRKR